MPNEFLNKPTPARTRTHARLSKSISTSTSDKNFLSFLESTNTEDGDIAKQITEFWKVQDSELVVLEYGKAAVAKIHRRMLYMSRRQKLNHVESLENYFMACLMRKKRAKPDTERTDEFYEQYVARQKERGQ
jgi:hypothetical protein